MKKETFTQAKQKMANAKEEWGSFLHDHFPLRSQVRYQHNCRSSWQEGFICRHGSGGDVQVHLDTGREVWVRGNNHWGQLEAIS